MAPSRNKIPGRVQAERARLPRWVDARNLAANTAEDYTVPAWAEFIIMSGTAGFYINGEGTAAAPADTTDGTASMFIPSSAEFNVDKGDVISIMSTSNAIVTIAAYTV